MLIPLTKFKELLYELDKLKLPEDKYVIFGSGPLAVRNIRESRDIDVIVTIDLWDELIKKHKPQGGTIKIGRVEIGKDYKPWFEDTNELFNDSELIDGHRFVKLKYVLIWKKTFGRDKDKEDVKLIKIYLKKK